MNSDTDIREKCIQIVSRCWLVPQDAVDLDLPINALGPLDSLTFELLMIEIEETTGRLPDLESVVAMETLREIIALIET